MKLLPFTRRLTPQVAFGAALLALTPCIDAASQNTLTPDTWRASIPFLANQGQIENADVAYYLPMYSGAVAVMQDGSLIYRLLGKEGDVDLEMRFLHASKISPYGINPTTARFSHIKGADPDGWQTNLTGYQSVAMGNVYEGISLTLEAGGNNMEKVFTVAPGHSPETIQMILKNASGLDITPEGQLRVELGEGHVFLSKPYAFQWIDGQQTEVPAAYRVLGHNEIGYRVDAYDTSAPLVIDPLLTGTYLGGSKADAVQALVATDNSVYVAGYTASTAFPPSTNKNHVARNDIFVAKFNRDLRQLQASTLIGGNGNDIANAMQMALTDSSLYVAGHTESPNFPAFHTYGKKGQRDAFVIALDKNLTNLLASARIGVAKGISSANGLITTTNGNVLITGYTSATGAPFVPLEGPTLKNYNAYVASFSTNGLTLANAVVFGASSRDLAYCITTCTNGNILVGGVTSSTNMPIQPQQPDQPQQFKEQLGGLADGFIALIDAPCENLLALTYFGGEGLDGIYAMQSIKNGTFVIAGETGSGDFPATQNAIQTDRAGAADAFVAILGLQANLFTLERATYLGASQNDKGQGLAIHTSGSYTNIYLTGSTSSDDFPGTALGLFTNRTGKTDAFVARLDGSLTNLFEASYLGGSRDEEAVAITLDTINWHVLVGGWTESTNFPVWQNAYDKQHHAGQDGFVSIFPTRLQRANIASLGHTNWVVIADAGNEADMQVTTNLVRSTTESGDIVMVPEVTTQLVGRVDYEFRMSTYAVSNQEYADFLNNMSLPSGITLRDPYLRYTLGLYHESMSISVLGGIDYDDIDGMYAPIEGKENDPITFVDYYTACRYANWLHHGSPTNEPGNWTETGAYQINAGFPPPRQPAAMLSLPTIDEWHKAAYYKGNGTDAGYWMYPTTSDQPPTAAADQTGTNNLANYNLVLEAPTSVKAYADSKSPYGTVNQGGNVWEWVEPDPHAEPDNKASIRGGSYLSPEVYDLSRFANERQEASNTVSGIGIRLIWHQPQ